MFLEAQSQCEGPALSQTLSQETIEAARRGVEDLFAELAIDPRLYDRMLSYLGKQAQIGHLIDPFDRPGTLDLLTRATIKITPSLLDRYEELISRDLPEESYQAFLRDNPVLLDPLASQVVPKQRLGLEYATDFAIRRFDDRWLLVEIEKPQTHILVRSGDFSAAFNHGFGQVLDFQRWVEENSAYARTLMPGVASPRGILVVGRRTQLSDDGASRLRRFCANSSTIEVLTFDDVLRQARNLYENLRHRPSLPARSP